MTHFILRPIYQHRLGSMICNDNNHWEYFPININENCVIVDVGWFYELRTATQQIISQIIEHFGFDFKLGQATIPHDRFTGKHADVFIEIYKTYLSQYDYNVWYPYVKDEIGDVDIIELTRSDLKHLLFLTSKTLTGECLDKVSYLRDNCYHLVKKIQSSIDKFNYCFVKTATKSSKNQIAIAPLTCVSEIIDNITSIEDHEKEYKKQYLFDELLPKLIIMKFNDILDTNREFRVIINNRKIIGISQQLWYKYCYLTDHMMYNIANSLVKYYNEKLIKMLPYNDVVLDIWTETDEINQNVVPHLIECNPGDLYGSSGSALFNWLDLINKNKLEVRYVERL